MKSTKRARLEAHGWRVGSAAEFLELTPEEAAFVETKLALSRCVRSRRTAQNVSQAGLAKRLKSSQSRVAKLEAAAAEFQETRKLSPDFADAHNNLGIALASLGKLDEAIEHFREAIRLDPSFPDAKNNLAIALAQKKGAGR